MPMPILLPSRGIALVMVSVLDAPVPSGSLSGAQFFFHWQAGEENAGMTLGEVLFCVAPIALYAHSGASTRQPCIDGGDGSHGSLALVNAPVVTLQTQLKKGEPWRALAAPSNRLEVLALVPMR